MENGDFISEIIQDLKGLAAPLIALLNGIKVIIIKLFELVVSLLKSVNIGG